MGFRHHLLAPLRPRSAGAHRGDSGAARRDDIIHSAHGNPGGGLGFAAALWMRSDSADPGGFCCMLAMQGLRT